MIQSYSPDIKEELTLSPPWQKEDFIHSKFRVSKFTNINQTNNWDRLSDEIIIIIFSWLPKSLLCKISLVSHRFYTLCHDESLWSSIDLSCRKVSLISLLHILNLGNKVLKLSRAEILTSSHIPTKKLSPIFESIIRPGKLTHLDLSFTTLGNDSLYQILEKQNNLTHLSLEDCILDDKIGRYISQNKNLMVLNLCRCGSLNSSILQQIFISCDKLVELNIGWTNMDPDSIKNMCHSMPLSLLRLNVSGNRESMSDENVCTVAKRCKLLQELDLSDCNLVGDDSIALISKSLTDLKIISLSRCYKLEPNGLLNLKSLKKLKHLDIFNLLNQAGLVQLKEAFVRHGLYVEINQNLFSTVSRPTTGINRTSVWKKRTRDLAC